MQSYLLIEMHFDDYHVAPNVNTPSSLDVFAELIFEHAPQFGNTIWQFHLESVANLADEVRFASLSANTDTQKYQ